MVDVHAKREEKSTVPAREVSGSTTEERGDYAAWSGALAARSGSDGGKLHRVRVDGWVDASCRVFVLNFGLCCGGPWEKSAKASSSSS
ncbi:hypothetical protein GEV33_003383 [Tenebrio molitor]|uniref:Uncharacterized protein n=1 Tax=Tenebrio molitor TaxID=7067 RepID=A0A8J6HTM7_TENMO|nr:hypothetical protein GEV33_003383 [Tenebrio molitor]